MNLTIPFSNFAIDNTNKFVLLHLILIGNIGKQLLALSKPVAILVAEFFLFLHHCQFIDLPTTKVTPKLLLKK